MLMPSTARSLRGRFLSELIEFVRFPSVSADPRHAADVRSCAGWLVDHLRAIGLNNARLIGTPRHPIVYADWMNAARRPTVLVYGHYDVQPADPEREWTTPPFRPVVRAGNLYGRGACDDKGQMFAHVKALELFMRNRGSLPVNVKCIFEGEEEIGSPGLLAVLARSDAELAANVVVMSDSPMADADRPAITYSLRGSLGLELEIRGPRRDLHSGLYGGAVHNPLQALCGLIAGLHDHDGRVAIPGFYDRVRPVSRAERQFMARNGPNDARVRRDATVTQDWGELGYSLYERTTIRPALTINGLTGGYQGPGGKAVIPAMASAKLSFRLVPDQDPAEIKTLLCRQLARAVPSTARWTLRTTSSARPALVDRRHRVMRAAAQACAAGFGVRPAFLRMGGTIPVVSAFQQSLDAPTVLMGFAPPDARIHAPDEHFPLGTFFKAIAASAHFLRACGQGLPVARDDTRRAPARARP
jgi:acetylornithine deacetylase/succinyl-diaminopimelate desuccinylase-like protein